MSFMWMFEMTKTYKQFSLWWIICEKIGALTNFSGKSKQFVLIRFPYHMDVWRQLANYSRHFIQFHSKSILNTLKKLRLQWIKHITENYFESTKKCLWIFGVVYKSAELWAILRTECAMLIVYNAAISMIWLR